ncbi:hypothetical protein GCM10017653_17560 [Ancylobacter defluvii]|uniref:Uncharacterized protein n=1 Tax=Ancylobacter defluvii TaxID=1282440 RepID=A0A9W6JV27_9HYPH|nr:hypothetical protein GCM10017653_17560 [Ancylobacter defluvii]
MDLQQVLADRRATPDTIQQSIFGDELAIRLAQNLEDLKCSTAERRRHSAYPELPPAEIYLALA